MTRKVTTTRRECTGLPSSFCLRYFGQAPNARHQLPWPKRFDDIVVGPTVQCAHDVLLLRFGGEHHDWHFRPGGMCADSLNQLEPVDIRQHHVKQDECWLGYAVQ